MGWRPPEFWSVTVTEFFVAMDAFNDMHRDPKETEPPSGDEMAKLLAKYGST